MQIVDAKETLFLAAGGVPLTFLLFQLPQTPRASVMTRKRDGYLQFQLLLNCRFYCEWNTNIRVQCHPLVSWCFNQVVNSSVLFEICCVRPSLILPEYHIKDKSYPSKYLPSLSQQGFLLSPFHRMMTILSPWKLDFHSIWKKKKNLYSCLSAWLGSTQVTLFLAHIILA